MNPENLLTFIRDKLFFTRNSYKVSRKNTDLNFVICRFPVEIIVILLRLGATEEAAKELKIKLRHSTSDEETILSDVKSALAVLTQERSCHLKLINKIYISKNFAIKEDFKLVARNHFNTFVESIDFTKPEEATLAIEEWITQQSNNWISSVTDCEEITAETRMLSVNACNFSAKWKLQFTKELTYERDFFRMDDEVVRVHTMQNLANYNFYQCEELNVQFLEIKFLHNEGAMIIVLPDEEEEEGLFALEDQLEKVINIEPEKFKEEVVKLELPRFLIETALDFKDVLNECGIKKIFKNDRTQMSGVAVGEENLYVNNIVQKCIIKVWEEGVDTVVGSFEKNESSSVFLPPLRVIQFIVNRPFMFYVKINNAIIFIGRVLDPRISNTME